MQLPVRLFREPRIKISKINKYSLVRISNSFLLWSPYPTTPTGTYVLLLQDTSGQKAYSPQFVMQPAGSNPSATNLHFTNTVYDIVDSSPFNVTWTGASGKATLSLQNGTSNAISTADTILCEALLLWRGEYTLICVM